MTDYVDAEGATITWLKALGVADGLVFTARPKGEQLPREFVVVQSVGGIVDSDIKGHALADLQFEAWAKNKKAAAAIAWTIASAVTDLVNGQQLADGVACNGGDVTLAPLWRPEEDAKFARYVLGARIRLWPTAIAA